MATKPKAPSPCKPKSKPWEIAMRQADKEIVEEAQRLLSKRAGGAYVPYTTTIKIACTALIAQMEILP